MDNQTQNSQKSVVFSFGPYRLYPARQLLIRSGETVKIGGRAFEILNLLVRRAGENVSKEELTAAAWPGVFVHESNLKVNLHSLRRSIDDVQKPPKYILTVPGRGYRFIARVDVAIADEVGWATTIEFDPSSRLPKLPEVIGRAVEISDVAHLLLGEQQLVSVVGGAGVGKTAVAIHAAALFGEHRRNDVCFVDLSKIDDHARLPSALADALGLPVGASDPLSAVCDYLRPREVLLLLDNCEHILLAVTLFFLKLRSAPIKCKLLLTSREPIRVPCEHAYMLDTLRLPQEGSPRVSEIISSPAVELFLRRAAERTGYKLVKDDVGAVAKICRALEGLPLALELGAANLDGTTPSKMLATLDKLIDFSPARATPNAPERHASLHAALDWSFRLLSEQEALVFCMTSVFSGEFELEDALALAEALDLPAAEVIGSLGSLVTKSLIIAQVNGPGLRYRLSDSTRRFSARGLKARGLETRCWQAHSRRMLALLQQASAEWSWRDRGDWSRSYSSRLNDLHASLSWAFGGYGDPTVGVALTAASLSIWRETSLVAEARMWIGTALASEAVNRCEAVVKSKLLLARAWTMMLSRPYGEDLGHILLSAFEFGREAGCIEYQLQALLGLSYLAIGTGHIGRSVAWLEEFRLLADRHHCDDFDPEYESALAWARGHAGNVRESAECLETLARKYVWKNVRSRNIELLADRNTGITGHIPLFAWIAGRPDFAAALALQTLADAESEGSPLSQSNILAQAVCPVALYRGDVQTLETGINKLRSVVELGGADVWVPAQRFYAAAMEDLEGDGGAAARMRGAIDDLISSRFVLRLPGFIVTLAEIHLRKGELDLASDALDLAERYEERQGELWVRPELRRIRASYCGSVGEVDSAEKFFTMALDEARTTGARSFELRAATSLARHRFQMDQAIAASEILLTVMRHFKEGFATRDYLVASELLKQTVEDIPFTKRRS